MANDGTVKIGAEVDEKKFQSSLSKLGKTAKGAMNGLDEETERVSSALKDAGENALSFGDILKANIVSDVVVDGIQKITHGLGDFAWSSLESGMNFEAQMSRVQAISGATAEDAGRLADKAKKMGESTVFSATESAEALEYMAMAGWKTDDMLDGLAGIMNLAAASGEDLASTSDIVTDALTAFGMKAEESGRFADILAAASTNANTNVGMMGETFKYVAPVAGALGYSAEDSAVAIALMANSGIKASQAGTALRSMLSRLAKPTDEVQAAMDALDLSLQNSDGSMKSLMDVMDDMRSGFKNLMIPQKEFDKAFAELNASFEAGEITEKNYEAALNAVMNANPFVLVATLIAGVVTALTTLYLTNETFRNKVNAAWTSEKGTISNSIHAIVDFFTKDIPNAAQEALDWFLSIPDRMKDIGEDVVRKLWEGITGMGEWLRGKVDGFISGIISAVTGGGSKSSSSGGGSSRPRSSPASTPVSRMAASANESDGNGEEGISLAASTFSRVSAVRALESAIPAAESRVAVATAAMAPASTSSYKPELGAAVESLRTELGLLHKELCNMSVIMDGRTVGRLIGNHQNNMGRAFGTM